MFNKTDENFNPCCCLSLQTGVKIIAFLHMIMAISICLLGVFLVLTGCFKENVKDEFSAGVNIIFFSSLYASMGFGLFRTAKANDCTLCPMWLAVIVCFLMMILIVTFIVTLTDEWTRTILSPFWLGFMFHLWLPFVLSVIHLESKIESEKIYGPLSPLSRDEVIDEFLEG